MILVDTSAWVEFLRGTGSATASEVRALVGGDAEIATCDAIRMEVLAGARDRAHLADLRALLARCVNLPLEPEDYEVAASLHRTCRQNGETVRKLVDCLIAASAIRRDVVLLHLDADFDAIARHSALRAHAAGGAP
ncbi:MAG: type II toxin-antitoxin system VapC family toxin [Miltoncostaeaceae bacterium]